MSILGGEHITVRCNHCHCVRASGELAYYKGKYWCVNSVGRLMCLEAVIRKDKLNNWLGEK